MRLSNQAAAAPSCNGLDDLRRLVHNAMMDLESFSVSYCCLFGLIVSPFSYPLCNDLGSALRHFFFVLGVLASPFFSLTQLRLKLMLADQTYKGR